MALEEIFTTLEEIKEIIKFAREDLQVEITLEDPFGPSYKLNSSGIFFHQYGFKTKLLGTHSEEDLNQFYILYDGKNDEDELCQTLSLNTIKKLLSINIKEELIVHLLDDYELKRIVAQYRLRKLED